MNDERGMDFAHEGYKLICMNRRSNNGGGVAMYVNVNHNYKVVENMSTVVDNVLERITIDM